MARATANAPTIAKRPAFFKGALTPLDPRESQKETRLFPSRVAPGHSMRKGHGERSKPYMAIFLPPCLGPPPPLHPSTKGEALSTIIR